MKTKTIFALLLAAISLLLTGCIGSAPTYNGDMSSLPTDMRPIDEDTAKGKMKFMIPAGYQPSKVPTHASNWAAEISGAYQKKVPGGAAVLITTCYTMFISKNGIAEALRSAVDPKATKVLGPNSVNGPTMLDPEFEVFDFNAIAQGLSIPMTALNAWKLDSSIGGCKYGIQMVGPRPAKNEMINDLVAILKTLE